MSPTCPRIPEPRLSANNLCSGEGGVPANHRSIRNSASRARWIGKPGCCNRALVDGVSENHNWRILLADASNSNSVAVLLHLRDANSAERIYAAQELAEGRLVNLGQQ
jgi:hypothetical protein